MYTGIMGLQTGGPTKWRDTSTLEGKSLDELKRLKRQMPRNLYEPLGTTLNQIRGKGIENPLGGPFRRALMTAIEARQDENIMKLLEPYMDKILRTGHEGYQDFLQREPLSFGEKPRVRVPYDRSLVPKGESDTALRQAIEQLTGDAVRDEDLLAELNRLKKLKQPAPTVNLRGGLRSLVQEGGTSVTGGRNVSRPSGVSKWRAGSSAFDEAATAMHRDRVVDASDAADKLGRKERALKYGSEGIGYGPRWSGVPGRLFDFAKRKLTDRGGLKSLLMMLGKVGGIATGGLGLAADQLMAFDELGSGEDESLRRLRLGGEGYIPEAIGLSDKEMREFLDAMELEQKPKVGFGDIY